MFTYEDYAKLREPFTPTNVKLTLLFESPPVGGKYFYNPEGKASEPLFRAIMKLFSWTPESKFEGLEKLKESGVLLLDSTYEQINKTKNKSERIKLIRGGYEQLCSILPDAPILIGMKLVHDVLADRLAQDGFEVLNKGLRIPFPALGHQREFHDLATSILAGWMPPR